MSQVVVIENEDPSVNTVSDTVKDDDDVVEHGPKDGALLPSSTKKYTLVLDLDETLIHSHVQYKRAFSTRAEQQDYFKELAHKFIQENNR